MNIYAKARLHLKNIAFKQTCQLPMQNLSNKKVSIKKFNKKLEIYIFDGVFSNFIIQLEAYYASCILQTINKNENERLR